MIPASVLEFLTSATASELTDRISDFRRLNFRRMTSAEISQALHKVLLGGKNHAAVPVKFGKFPSGTRFFRVRKPERSGTSLPMDCLVSKRDAWEPPARIVRANRLNKVNEPLLYTTPENLQVAMEEARLSDGLQAAIFVYKALRDVKVSVIGDRFDDLPLDPELKHKARLWADFLHDEFTRDAGPENEHVYRISETIAKDWFDFPPRAMQDAWCYPSVVAKPYKNVCFRPEFAHECLNLVGAMVGVRQGDRFAVKQVAILLDDSFSYHGLGTTVQRSVFPEIIVDPADIS